MQAWNIFQEQVLSIWYKCRIRLLRNVLIISVLAGTWASFIPDEYRTNIVIYPEDENTSAPSLNSILGSLPVESKGTGTIKAILASHSLRNAVIRDTLNIHGETESVAAWLRKDFIRKHFITGNISPPPESGEGLHTFANRYLSRIMLIFTDDDGFISLRMATTDDSLTLMLGHTIIKHAQNYHIRRQQLKNADQLSYLNMRADSVKRELENVQKNIAFFGDQKRYTARYSEEVGLQELYQQQSILQQLYVSVSMLKEESVSRNQNAHPLFQVLDPPQKPLDIMHAQVWMYGLGAFLMSGIFLFLIQIRKPVWHLIKCMM